MKFNIGDIVKVVSKRSLPWLSGSLGAIHKVFKGENGSVKYGVAIDGKNNMRSKEGLYWFYECEIESVADEKDVCSTYPEIKNYIDTDTDIWITNKLANEFAQYHKKQETNYIMSKLKVATIKNVIFNPPATIVFWQDGTKTVVKCSDLDDYDPEKGLAMAIAKKALGNEGNYYNVFRKWLPKAEDEDDFDFADMFNDVFKFGILS